MHRDFLPYLCDPHTREPLELTVIEERGGRVLTGTLRSSTASYPIVRGIPRFAGYDDSANYTGSFSYQWQKWSRIQFDGENVGGPMANYTGAMWDRICGTAGKDLTGKVLVDIGCGPGRFIDVARRRGARVIGLDLSGAVEAAQENFAGDPAVLICQADVLHPPVVAAAMDGAYSIGVLHHTPDPREGFRHMAALVKPGGNVAVCVYTKGGYYDFPTVKAWRTLFKALWPVLQHRPPLAYAWLAANVIQPLTRSIPILGQAVRLLLPYCPLPDRRWTLLDTFDSVTPSYQSAHETYEVFSWFKSAGLVEVEPSDWGYTAFHGRASPVPVPIAAASGER